MGSHCLPQAGINAILIHHAGEGRLVVRLKGGDPFVFGRGGEEALALSKAGIPFEVVPGVSSAIAVPAYAGIPVTHRGVAASFAVLTGHEDPSKKGDTVDWAKLATAVDTLVVLMAVGTFPRIVGALLANGRPPETPVALIRWGTTEAQEVRVGTLADIVGRARGLEPPVVAVIGEVVRLRERLDWAVEAAGRPRALARRLSLHPLQALDRLVQYPPACRRQLSSSGSLRATTWTSPRSPELLSARQCADAWSLTV